jgi:hypothetical protein
MNVRSIRASAAAPAQSTRRSARGSKPVMLPEGGRPRDSAPPARRGVSRSAGLWRSTARVRGDPRAPGAVARSGVQGAPSDGVRILDLDEIKTVPHVPLSHPCVERLIGTMRREFLDQVLFWNARDPERKLADFQAYDNAARSHESLEGHTPDLRRRTHGRPCRAERALGLPLPGPRPAPVGGLTTNSRRTGR